jgi:ribonuclease HI
MKLVLQCDGGSRGNPGPAASGYVVYDVTGVSNASPSELPKTRLTAASQSGAGIILEKCGNYLGVTTNNLAEYDGLISGLNWIVTNHPEAEVLIKMDSLLIVNQIKGLFKVKSPGLIPKFQEARGLLAQLPAYRIEHTFREGNSLADSLVNEVLDSQG